jgi:hypothetical protein
LDLLRAKSAPSTAAGSKKSEDKKQKHPISMEMSFISTSIDVKLKSYKECVFKYLIFIIFSLSLSLSLYPFLIFE